MFINDRIVISPLNSEVFFEGYIRNFAEDEISISTDSKSSLLDFGQEVELFVYNRFKGELKYKGIITEVEKNQLIINNLKSVYTKQRRSEVRINVLMPVKIFEVFYNNKLIELEKYLYVNIIDISANGILVKTSLELPLGLKFLLSLNLDERKVEAAAEIVRTELKGGKYLYGCYMTTINKEDEAYIRQFVLKRQLEEKKKQVHVN